MKHVILAFAAVAIGGVADAATFSDRATFQATLPSFLTDTYEESLGYPTGFNVLTDAEMSAVVGQTRYQTTGHSDNNILFTPGPAFSQTYCAGCNGSFTLSFTNTSYGSSAGVFGVGFDVLVNEVDVPYVAFVTYGDASTENIALATTPAGITYFFGLTADAGIRSIAFGLADGGTTVDGLFAIDNLTIGGTAVPEPSSWAMMILGFGLAGAAMRRPVRIAYCRAVV